MKNPMASLYVVYTNENSTKKIAKFGRLWVKEPRDSEIVSAENKVYLYRSARQP